jgi:hypothetical protein
MNMGPPSGGPSIGHAGITFVEAGLETRLYVAAAIESQYLWCQPVPVTAR